jgi:putative membrane protein
MVKFGVNKMMGYCDFGYGMGFFGWIFMVLFWAGVILLIVWLVRQNSNQENRTERRTPSDILKERFAKGEISKKEFDEMKKELSK